MRVLPNERAPSKEASGTPLPDSRTELPPVIRRAEVVAFALVALLIICVVAVLYVAKAFFLPVVAAFVVGTMLSPAASFLERRRIPRAVAAILIVAASPDAKAFMVQSSKSVDSATGARVADPDDVQQDFAHRWASSRTTTLGTQTIGNTTLRFGMSQSDDGAFGGNNWFLESPAARTVPSQR